MSGAIILNCIICGFQLENEEQQCPACKGTESNVQVLTRKKRQEFDGITLEQEETQDASASAGYTYHASGQRQYSKSFTIAPTSLFTKVVVGIIFAALLVLVLPVALFLIGITIISVYFFRK